jgi:hypothetical protein
VSAFYDERESYTHLNATLRKSNVFSF